MKTAEEMAREHVDQWVEERTIQLCNVDLLTKFLTNLLEYERGQGQGWVPVSERLPETNAFGWSDPVAIWPALVWRPGEEFALPGKWGSGVKRAYFNKDGSFYGSSLEDDAETGIQMWCPQPLPAPPEEKP